MARVGDAQRRVTGGGDDVRRGGGEVVLARPGVERAEAAGVPRVRASVAGTVPPTAESVIEQTAVLSSRIALGRALSVIVPWRPRRGPSRCRPGRCLSPNFAVASAFLRCASNRCPSRWPRAGRCRFSGTRRRPAGARSRRRRRGARVVEVERAGPKPSAVPAVGLVELHPAGLRAGAGERPIADLVAQYALSRPCACRRCRT